MPITSRTQNKKTKIDINLAKSFLKELIEFCNINNLTVPYAINSFYKDIAAKSVGNDTVTLERATRFAYMLRLFLVTNNISLVESDSFNQLFGQLTKTPQGVLYDIHVEYMQAIEKIYSVLERVKKDIYIGSELYYVSKKERDVILDTIQRLQLSYENIGPSYKKRFNIFLAVNPIGKLEYPVSKFTVSYNIIPRSISEPESVDKYLEEEKFRTISHIRAEEKKLLNSNTFDDKTIAGIKRDTKLKEAKVNEEYNKLVKNRDDYIIRITSVEDEKAYPEIRYTFSTPKKTKEGKDEKKEISRSKYAHLKLTMPNLIWYEPKPLRKNFTAMEFLKEATNAFGYVYYVPKTRD